MEDKPETKSGFGGYEIVTTGSDGEKEGNKFSDRENRDLQREIGSTRSDIRGSVGGGRPDVDFAHEDTMPPSVEANPYNKVFLQDEIDSLESRSITVGNELRRCKCFVQELVSRINTICNDFQKRNECRKDLREVLEFIKLFVCKLNSLMLHCEKVSQDTCVSLFRKQMRIILHDLKQPLSAMMLGCEDILKNWDEVDFDYIQEIFKIFREQCEEFMDTFERILSYGLSIMDSSHIGSLTESLPVLPSMISEVCKQKGHTINTEVKDRMMNVSLGLVQLNYILRELVANSVDAMDENGEVNIVFSREEDRCKIEVSDNGSGIKPRDIVMIFEPRFSTKAGGGGIGLTEIKRILDDTGGSIQVSSKQNKGTTVTIWLPIKKDDRDWKKNFI